MLIKDARESSVLLNYPAIHYFVSMLTPIRKNLKTSVTKGLFFNTKKKHGIKDAKANSALPNVPVTRYFVSILIQIRKYFKIFVMS